MSILNRIQSSAIDFLVASLIAALVVVAPAPLCAQQSTAPKAAAKALRLAEEENEAPTPKKSGDEGIKVHGHWILDVKDKDGKIVEHRDFHNALVADGAATLISLITGASSPEQMVIALQTSAQANGIGLYVSGSAFSVGATCANYYTVCYSGLTRSLGVSNTQQVNAIILTGSVPSQSSAYTVSGVFSMLNSCGVSSGTAPTSISPATCASSGGSVNTANNQFYVSNFTAATISPLSVAAGQALSVKFTLSFS